MKISRRVGLILAAIAIVGALIGTYVVYSGQAAQRSALTDRLNRAQSVLPVLINQKEDLQGQLANAQSTLHISQAEFPQSIQSIEYGEYLYEIARNCNVQLASLTFPQPTNKTVGAVTYSVVSLSLPVSGALDDIFKFIMALRTDARFASTEVTAISMNIRETTTATINVDVYAHKG
ncbi:MAG: hypothetical protein ACXQTH_00010 [Dehalococcoidia bacterium]